jgi:hypothetical protein
MARCELCHRNQTLCQSHIIPEFLYTSLYNDDSRMMGVTGLGGKGWKLVQRGIYEDLLCRDCESLLNERYEIPFQRQWTRRYPLPDKAIEGDVVQAKFDYASFKLFHLSILFRAAVSTNAMFGAVKLGRHLQILRHMVLESDQGRPDQYPIFATALINVRNEIERRVVMAPTMTRINGHHIYGFVFDGVLWWYSVSSTVNRDFIDIGLQSDGSMCFYVTPWQQHVVFQRAANAIRQPRPMPRPAVAH